MSVLCVCVFKRRDEPAVRSPNFTMLVEYSLCMPGTSAPVERVFFPIMIEKWSDNRGRLEEENIKAEIITKINIELQCPDYYNKIKDNKAFLKKNQRFFEIQL